MGMKPVDPQQGWRTQIIVVQNHNDLRRGERAEVLITPRLRRLAAQGLIRFVGEPVDPNRDTEPPTDTEVIEETARTPRRKAVEETPDGGTD